MLIFPLQQKMVLHMEILEQEQLNFTQIPQTQI